ncbi:odorant receptor 30a-like isoform X2 [Nomia melanderi]|uniref:odorant receptor 30a-like isoform X2 n=1 Tax=Nomia melanderi TaxID=2448451 RepID=UPI003FCE8729
MKKKDISIPLMFFLLKMTGCVASSKKDRKILRRGIKMTTAAALLFASYTGITDICHTLDDIDNVLYMTCNTALVTVAFVKFMIVCFFEDEIHVFVKYAQRNFWHSNYDDNEEVEMTRARNLSTLTLGLTYAASIAVVGNYILTPIVMNMRRDNNTRRALIYRLYFDSVYVSPYYEMTFLMQTLSTIQVAITYTCVESLLCVFNPYLSTQFRIVGYRLSSIWNENDGDSNSVGYTDKCYARMKKYIRQHQALIEFSNEFDAIQVILFSYSCGILINSSEEITLSVYATSLFSAPMDKSGRLLRKDMQIIMLRTQKPCYLTACGFFPISLETSTKLFSTAMSYFTLLKQSSTED